MTPQLRKFLKIKKDDMKDIVRGYIIMRKMFIDNGVKDRQLEKGEGMTREMYMQRERVGDGGPAMERAGDGLLIRAARGRYRLPLHGAIPNVPSI